jgi:hypothetical protein
MYLDNCENNNWMYVYKNVHIWKSVKIKCILVYLTLAALKYKGRYKQYAREISLIFIRFLSLL